MIHRAKPSNRRRGAAAVEFAFAISTLLLVVAASIEFVRLNMMEHCVDHASYLAARKGIVIGAKSSEVKNIAHDHLALFGVTGATVTVSPDPITDDAEIVEVNVVAPISGNSWISPLYFNGNIEGRTRMLADRAAADMNAALVPPPAS